ncbi:MAG: class I tRNA ligase family protein, partial [Clostridia bacterium]|nr:class I tRNA ligase family protein [Clostridia bacterium]
SRYWGSEMTQDKINAYMTLYTALVTTAKTAAPMIPFMTEEIYQNLVRSIDKEAPESIHLCAFPEVNENFIDPELEADMEEVLSIVTLGRACRNGSSRKNRQPLAKMFVKADKALSDYYVEIIEEELNVKAVEFVEDDSALVTYAFKPQMRTLGPKFGKQLGDIRNALAAIEDGSAAKAELDTTGFLTLTLPTGDVRLAEEDLLIEAVQQEGLYTLSENGVTVALDTVLTPELEAEGLMREVISKVQTMRKDAGFEVTDHIVLYVAGSDVVKNVVADNAATVQKDVLADGIAVDSTLFADEASVPGVSLSKEWKINGEAAVLGVKKV